MRQNIYSKFALHGTKLKVVLYYIYHMTHRKNWLWTYHDFLRKSIFCMSACWNICIISIHRSFRLRLDLLRKFFQSVPWCFKVIVLFAPRFMRKVCLVCNQILRDDLSFQYLYSLRIFVLSTTLLAWVRWLPASSLLAKYKLS